jgi:hypothetical protein
MNKLDSSSPILIYSENTDSHLNHMPACRLIVLIPTASDYTSATRRIADLAKASGAHVLFLGLCRDVTQELSLRRELVTLSALLQAARVPAEAKVEIGMNWVNIVKRSYQAGDAILCFEEQQAGLLHRPLSQILESNLKAPVYILSDVSPRTLPQSDWLSQIMAWSGSVGIIISFFLLQIRINSYPQDWAQTTLMILSVIGEIWLIWVWNRLFS